MLGFLRGASILDKLRLFGIQVITISIDVDKDVLWSRIQKRLKKEPWREKYHEVCRNSLSGRITQHCKGKSLVPADVAVLDDQKKASYDGFKWDCVSIFVDAAAATFFFLCITVICLRLYPLIFH